jgi:short-subunit dehydrogenase
LNRHSIPGLHGKAYTADKGVSVTAICPGNTQTSFFEVANANTQNMRFATPEQVVKEGLAAFSKNKNYQITGGLGNYIQSQSSRFLPRKTNIRIVANRFRSRVAHAAGE